MRLALAAAVLSFSCASPLERCAARGGRWFVGPRAAPPSQQRGACLMQAADAGKPCRDRVDCQVLCLCTGALGFPAAETHPELDQFEGTEAEGACAEYPPASGSGWWCTVDGGRVHRHGIIVD